MKKNLLRFSFLFLCFALLLSSTLHAETKIIASQAGGILLEKEGQKILILQGTPYQMGYQHGVLLKREVREMIDKVLAISFSQQPGWIDKAWEQVKDFIPPRYREEMRGLAEGSGVPLRKIELANIFPELFHCSGGAFFGKATLGGEFFHIRILDYMTEPNFQKNAVVMVVKPQKGNAFISAGFAGFIGSVTGMNVQGIAIGEMGGEGFGKWKGIPMAFLFRKALEEANTFEEAVKIFRDSPRTCEYYYVISEARRKKAIGIRATPEEFQTLKPGEASPLLPLPLLPDTLIISGGSRYRLFLERVKENYGKIDLKILQEIMKRPVAMKSNLHNAIFIPNKLKMYLSIAANPSQPNYQACYQKYVEFDLKELMNYREEKKETTPAVPEKEEKGIIPASQIIGFSSYREKGLSNLIDIYRKPAHDIPYTLTLLSRQPDFYYYRLTFPSLYPLSLPGNDRVVGEYIESRKETISRGGKKPGIIILDISQGDFQVARLIASRLANAGINSLIIALPLSSMREPSRGMETLLKANPLIITQAIVQAVNDIRAGTSWLMSRPDVDSNRIGICGVSLGGMIGVLSAGVLGDFSRGAFLLTGGDLYEIISRYQDSPQYQKITKTLEALGGKGGMEKFLRNLLSPYDPITFAPRLDKSEILLINTENDEIIPRASTLALRKSLPRARILWYPGGHYDIQEQAVEILGILTYFFSSW
ncbi:MAG: hypothetical protein GXO71_01235 [Caldiserica bacterium]|nr:hypothetical protein [Caldisericota bacterium]